MPLRALAIQLLVRRAANVEYVWIPEEVQLQQRLWEIQLEKTTDLVQAETTR